MGSVTRNFVAVCRVALVICSMLAVVAMCVFAVTGMMLTHPKGFGLDRPPSYEIRQTIPAEVARRGNPEQLLAHLRALVPQVQTVQDLKKVEGAEGQGDCFRVILNGPQHRLEAEVAADGQVTGTLYRIGKIPVGVVNRGDTREIARSVRQAFPDAGAVEAVEESGQGDDKTYRVILSRPGRRFDCEVDAKGNVAGTLDDFGAKRALVNLHKGRFADSKQWRILMDVAAICLLVACVTGIVLSLATRKRRILGLAAFGTGLAVYIGAYVWLVP
ncbi:MAG TPA: PepSY-associated TM helix domain-containing protein [Phycisphaerae bacterium]|nr:PepSY-associated TM helix domain-containing protein [Phycisphaerae bacterium]